jgi:hypothetical protein
MGQTFSAANALNGGIAGGVGGAISGAGATLDVLGDIGGGWVGGNVSGRMYASLTGQTGEEAQNTIAYSTGIGIVGGVIDAANVAPAFGPAATGLGAVAANLVNKASKEFEMSLQQTTSNINDVEDDDK